MARWCMLAMAVAVLALCGGCAPGLPRVARRRPGIAAGWVLVVALAVYGIVVAARGLYPT